MAYQGIDLRDLFRPESGMTARSLMVRILALPAEAPLWAAMRDEQEQAKKPPAEVLRSRQAEWEARNAAQRAKEAS